MKIDKYCVLRIKCDMQKLLSLYSVSQNNRVERYLRKGIFVGYFLACSFSEVAALGQPLVMVYSALHAADS